MSAYLAPRRIRFLLYAFSGDCDLLLIGVGNFVRWINQKSLYADLLYVLFGLVVANDRPCFFSKCR